MWDWVQVFEMYFFNLHTKIRLLRQAQQGLSILPH